MTEKLSDTLANHVRAFNDCECARLLGMEIADVWDGGARVVMDTEGKRNVHRVAHGGAVFAVADQAFGIAANAQGGMQVAVSAHIHFIAPATGVLEAIAERRAESRDHSVYEVRVYADGRLVAQFEGVAWKKSGNSRI
ncbi:MAG: PaaI family thioesterase [Methanomicrobiales archaeon]|nr:PaaI family thioesterase [Methanomicrobiales archaeon]MDI6876374.1 PaaI family thioesterase [Methanomicrobiales archaeon]